MSNTKLSQIFDSRYELLEQPACLILFQSVFWSDVIEELSVATVLHDQENPLWGLDNFVNLDDIRVFYYLKYVNFSSHSLNIVKIFDFPLVENFDSDFLTGVNMVSLLNFSKSSLT